MVRWFVCTVLCALELFPARYEESRPKQTGVGLAADHPAQQSFTAEQSLATLFQVVQKIAENITNREMALIHNEDALLRPAFMSLLKETNLLSSSKMAEFRVCLVTFVGEIAGMHQAADAFDAAALHAGMPRVLQALERVKHFFSDKTLLAAEALANRFMCPMHPAIVGKRSDVCPKCGMELDQQVRVLPLQGSATMASEHTLRGSIRTDTPLTIEHPTKAFLYLTRSNGEAVLLSDLIEVHTEKIHLLIVDSSLTDYHHEHPRPTGNPGEYVFSFTPHKPGGYRAWADLRPYPVGFQEYVMMDIPSPAAGQPLTDKAVTQKVEVDGLGFELVLAQKQIQVGHPAQARLRITDANGLPFKQLEPIMATFAHLVGFNEDYRTVLHIHPKGTPVLDPQQRGGPELEFQIYSLQSGFFRLFAQVQVGAVSKFAPFGLQIVP